MMPLYVAPDSPPEPSSPPQMEYTPPVIVQPPPLQHHPMMMVGQPIPPQMEYTPPVIVQPPPLQHHPMTMLGQPIGAPWSTGLFDCQEDETNALMTAFFPCVTFGQIVEILEGGQTNCTMGSLMYILMASALCSCWIISSSYRRKLRERYNLVEAPAEDWTIHLFCPCCALCQEFRELKNKGIDPSLGWMGNLALQQNAAQTAPPKPQFMNM